MVECSYRDANAHLSKVMRHAMDNDTTDQCILPFTSAIGRAYNSTLRPLLATSVLCLL